jgi:hypothetical protein
LASKPRHTGNTFIHVGSCSLCKLSFIHPSGVQNRNNIIKALAALGGKAYPLQVMDMLLQLTRRGLITTADFDSYSPLEMNAMIRKGTMKERTMRKWLSILAKEGVLDHHDNQYSLTDKAKSDKRNFPELVGDSIISSLMLIHKPTVHNAEHNIRQLVESFGFYLLWCFAQGAKPLDESMSPKSKDGVVINWVEKCVNPLNVFEYFLAAIQHQEFDDTKVITQEKEASPSTDYFCFMKLLSRTKNPASEAGPKYELPEQTCDEILNLLRRIYPEYWKIIQYNPIPLSFNPKKEAMNN